MYLSEQIILYIYQNCNYITKIHIIKIRQWDYRIINPYKNVHFYENFIECKPYYYMANNVPTRFDYISYIIFSGNINVIKYLFDLKIFHLLLMSYMVKEMFDHLISNDELKIYVVLLFLYHLNSILYSIFID